MIFRKLFGAARGTGGDAQPGSEFPLEMEDKLTRLHSRVPVREHLEILHGGLRIGAESFTEVYFRCLAQTGTAVTPFNIFQRFQTRHDLLRYFLATLRVPGARVECGAYRGATALLLCHAWRSVDPDFRGAGFYLVDSFTGTSESTERDYIAVRAKDGTVRREVFFPAGKSDVSPEMVRGFMSDFPEAGIRCGWAPAVFDTLGENRYAFVHVDLTLFEATLAALEHFYPKLAAGGVILCDGSPFCPGVDQAVDRFSGAHDVAYATLGHRQYVFMKPSAPPAE